MEQMNNRRFVVLHKTDRYIRIRFGLNILSLKECDALEFYLSGNKNINKVKIYDRTGDVVIRWNNNFDENILEDLIEDFFRQKEEIISFMPENSAREINRKYQEKLTLITLSRIAKTLFLPMPIRNIFILGESIKFIGRGLKSIFKGKMEISVLDGVAITAALIQGDFKTASNIMYLLNVGEILEEWTYRKSVADLAASLSLNIDNVWIKEDDEEKLVPRNQIKNGDTILIRTSNIVPFDGKIVSGDIILNEASMTGESLPISKTVGGFIYAGTVVEEGSCEYMVINDPKESKYDKIVAMIEESEKLKSLTEEKAFHLADKLVPYSLLGALLTYGFTRNVMRAMSFLMVDFSCALKLAMPLTVLSAIRDAKDNGISVKGGKFLEAVADADTIVFDKTGTLTYASPKVEKIIPFNKMNEEECFRIAACLEEHYPHSIANAIVKESKERNIVHDEMHSEVKYVVAHGIASQIDEKKAIIGSHHFIFDDEGTKILEEDKEKYNELPAIYSKLFLAIDGVLSGVICIFDPLREEAKDVISTLRKLGISKICMMTGDNYSTANQIAKNLELDEVYAEVLPDDKAEFVKKERAAGRKVVMIGDGINDAPALSEADVGVAISHGAAIAKEISNITINGDSLYELVKLRILAMSMMKRIKKNYREIMTINGSLIGAGVLGIIAPSTSSLIHNSSTVFIGLSSMKKFNLEKHKLYLEGENEMA